MVRSTSARNTVRIGGSLCCSLPGVAITADDRVYVGIPLPANPLLRGRTLHIQAATLAGPTLKLTPPSELVLR